MTENTNTSWRERRQERHEARWSSSGRIWTGLLLLLIGGVALLRAMQFPVPYWLFTWQMLLIAIGLFSGFRNQFQGGFWIVLIVVGGIFLLEQYFPDLIVRAYFWPLGLIALGLLFILRPNRRRRDNWSNSQAPPDTGERVVIGNTTESHHTSDFIDSTSIFGGTKKIIVSKDFKGGEIVNIFGGSEIDLTQADINGTVRLELTQVFGGTKLLVPAHWQIKPEMMALFGGIEDKRRTTDLANDPNKVLVLNGTSIFAGIEIKTY